MNDVASFEVPAASTEVLIGLTGSPDFSEALHQLHSRRQETQQRLQAIADAELKGVGYGSVWLSYDPECINFFLDHYELTTGLLHLSRFDDSSLAAFADLDLRLVPKTDLKYIVLIRVKPAFFIIDGVKQAIRSNVRFVDLSEDRKVYEVVHQLSPSELSLSAEAKKLPLLSQATRRYEMIPINAASLWWDADPFEEERFRGVIRYSIIPAIERGNCQREVKTK